MRSKPKQFTIMSFIAAYCWYFPLCQRNGTSIETERKTIYLIVSCLILFLLSVRPTHQGKRTPRSCGFLSLHKFWFVNLITFDRSASPLNSLQFHCLTRWWQAFPMKSSFWYFNCGIRGIRTMIFWRFWPQRAV